MRRALRPPLHDAAFRRLALAYALGQLADWLLEIALSVAAYDRTHSALASAAVFLSVRFAPALAAPALSARIGSWGAGRTLAGLTAARAAAVGAIAGAAAGSPLALLVLLAAVDGVLAVTGRAMVRAAAAALLPEEGALRAGTAILNVVFSTMAAAGPATAGVLVADAGARTAIAVDAIVLAVAAVALAGARIGPVGPPARRTLHSLRRALANPALARLLVAEAAAVMFFTAVVPIEVVYAKVTLRAGDLGYGALLTSWGAGMVAGSALFALAARAPLRPLLHVSTAVVALAYVGSALAPSIAVACAAAAIGGIGNGVQWVALVCTVQRLARGSSEVGVMAVLESLAVAMPGVGFAIGGAVTAATSPRVTFAVAAGGILVVLLAGFRQRMTNFTMLRRFAGNSRLPERSIPRATAR